MPSWIAFATAASLVAAFALLAPMFFRKKWSPAGKHCVVTGGSQGLGAALAVLLAREGAHVSIVARNTTRLAAVVKDMESNRQNENQKFAYHSYDLSDAKSSEAAIHAASEAHGGRAADVYFLGAGKSTPGFFVEETEQSMQQGMTDGYWVQAWSSLAATKKMVADGVKGRVVFVSSMLGYFSFIGWASYAPPKHALRGLAETLRSELMLYGISISIMFPGTIFSPGLEEENKTKPKITGKIEGTDQGLTPAQAAAVLYRGVQRGQFHITVDFEGELFRASTRGATPFSNPLLDAVLDVIAFVGIPIWRRGVDNSVLAHRAEHQDYLRTRNHLSVGGQ